MTQREFFNAVITANISADITKFAQDRIAHLDSVNSNRKAKGTPTQRENAVLRATILATVKRGDEYIYTASEIGKMVGISTAKASALCKQIVDAKLATAYDVKFVGKGKVKGYSFTPDPEGQGDDLDTPEGEPEGQGENLDTED